MSTGKMIAGAIEHDDTHLRVVNRTAERGIELFEQAATLRVAIARTIRSHSRNVVVHSIFDIMKLHQRRLIRFVPGFPAFESSHRVCDTSSTAVKSLASTRLVHFRARRASLGQIAVAM